MKTRFECLKCHSPYPATGLPARCPQCGSLYGMVELVYHAPVDEKVGIWRYQEVFGLDEVVAPVYLGEGETPLVKANYGERTIYSKCEHLNPSGSFKDRGTAILASLLKARKINNVVEDSSGNAGGSLALYSKAIGIEATVFIPESTSGPKRAQMERIGISVKPISGPREAAHSAVERAVLEKGASYASHAYLPFHLAGYATILFEACEQLGEMPGTVIAPIGHGSLFLGLIMAGDAMAKAGLGSRPKYIGVQPANCAPVVKAWRKETFTGPVGPSLAEGTQVSNPVRGGEILDHLINGRDELLTIEEAEIIEASRKLFAQGLYIEPTSAMVGAALDQISGVLPEPIILVLTGSGLKFNNKH
ncbi:MAG: pyridoxal-phosphate dependent enzyme [Chloroflexi bacterium]|nr:pyridoxal-phosphate dependent enzyme [Chloroflexota bacterium]